MILNVLQDSKIKSDPSEDLEVNLNRMLDDFTIDYTFTHGNQKDEKKYLYNYHIRTQIVLRMGISIMTCN